MAQYKHLPIYKGAFDLLNFLQYLIGMTLDLYVFPYPLNFAVIVNQRLDSAVS